MFYNMGINDMPYGWYSENEWNKICYRKWYSMIARCYSKKYQEKEPSYKNCHVCKKWLKLSMFIEDVRKIDGYDEEKFLNGELELDKDIKSNGINKEYSLENCMFVTKKENVIQATKTRDYTKHSEMIKGENHPMYGKHHSEETKQKISISKKGTKLSDETKRKMSMSRSGENNCNYGKYGKNHPLSIMIVQLEKNTDKIINIFCGIKESGRLTNINHSSISQCCTNKRKSAGGYRWKYLSDVPEEDILNYIRHNMQVKIEEE